MRNNTAMRARALVIFGLFAAAFIASAAAQFIPGQGPLVPITGAGCGPLVPNCGAMVPNSAITPQTPLAIDGTPQGGIATGGTTCAPSALTTTTAGIVIFATHAEATAIQGDHPIASGVSGGGLTWARRSTLSLDGGVAPYATLDVWWAYSSGALTAQTITVTWGNVTIDDMSCVVFGVKNFTGTNYQTQPWDSNGSLPATASSTGTSAPTVSGVGTTSANTMLLGIGGTTSGTNVTAGSGFTIIKNQHNGGGVNASDTFTEQDVVSVTQSGISIAFTGSVARWTMIGDALAQSGSVAVASDPIPFIF